MERRDRQDEENSLFDTIAQSQDGADVSRAFRILESVPARRLARMCQIVNRKRERTSDPPSFIAYWLSEGRLAALANEANYYVVMTYNAPEINTGLRNMLLDSARCSPKAKEWLTSLEKGPDTVVLDRAELERAERRPDPDRTTKGLLGRIGEKVRRIFGSQG